MAKQLSKVEVKGLEARFYDALMDIITLGKYAKFIKSALGKIELYDNFKLIDFGAGTGRNIMIINRNAEKKGVKNVELYGADIGEIMSEKFKKKTSAHPNIHFIKHDIRKAFDFEEGFFDAGLISFVLHGFVQEDRDKILANFSKLIKPGGKLYILDYNEIDVDKSAWYVKFFFRKLECPLAEDFANRNLEEMLKPFNFRKDNYYLYFKDIIRMAVFEKNAS